MFILCSFIGNNTSLSHGSETDLQVSFQAAINLSLLSGIHLLIFQKLHFIKSLNRNNLSSKRDATLNSDGAELYCQQSSAGRRRIYIYISSTGCLILE